MIPSLFTKKSLLIAAVISLVIVGLTAILSVSNRQTKIVFCDVGQGDAAYLRVKNQLDLLVDAGPNKKVLSCLGKNMPFFDRKIELVILTHPQIDHFGGFLEIINRYQIDRFILPIVDSNSRSYQKLKNKLEEKKINLMTASAGDQIKLFNNQIVFFWPTKKWLTEKIVFDRPRKINGQVLGVSSLDTNFFSYVFSYQEDGVRVLFTGDSPSLVLDSLPEKDKLKSTILKIPHHGSKNGLTEKFLRLADPIVAVISVGKNNPFGHPHQEVLEMLQALKIKIRRTDTEGDIIFNIKN